MRSATAATAAFDERRSKKGDEHIMKSLGPRLLTAVIGIPAVLIVIIFSELWHPLVGIVAGLASVAAILISQIKRKRKKEETA